MRAKSKLFVENDETKERIVEKKRFHSVSLKNIKVIIPFQFLFSWIRGALKNNNIMFSFQFSIFWICGDMA